MSDTPSTKRLDKALDEVSQIADPLARLAVVRHALGTLERLETEAVVELRRAEVTWTTIGKLYGLTKQGAQQRFRAVRNTLSTET